MNWNTPSELYRNYALAGFDRPHNFQMGFAYALPWQTKSGYDNVFSAIVNDWQVNGLLAAFSGTPFTVTASGTSPEHAEQHADGRSRRHVHRRPARSARPARGSTRPRSRSRLAFVSVTPAATSSAARVAGTSTSPCSGRSRSAVARRLEYRLQAGNLFNHPVYANPNGDITSGDFGRILGIANQYPERQIQMGLRFSF